MNEQIAQQLGIGALLVTLGDSGWLLPYRWNILRLKRLLGQFFSEEINRMIPKIVGSVLLLVGLAILIATAVIGKFQ